VIDDVSALGSEICLIQELLRLLTPDGICNILDEEVHSIAGESLTSDSERKRLNQKLSILQRGLTQLERFKKDFQPESRARELISLFQSVPIFRLTVLML